MSEGMEASQVRDQRVKAGRIRRRGSVVDRKGAMGTEEGSKGING